VTLIASAKIGAEDNNHWYSVSSSGVEKQGKPRKSK
jgi:hypothetical protein